MVEPVPEDPRSVFNIQCPAICTFLGKPDNETEGVYSHQKEAVLSVMRQLEDPDQSNIALVVLPTGCGKTGVAVLASFALNATRVLVVTPSAKISLQIYEAFCDTKHAFLTRIVKDRDIRRFIPSAINITKASQIQQKLNDNLMVINAHKVGGNSSVAIDDIPTDNYDLVIVDEAHHYPAPLWKQLVDHFPRSRRLFLTATPYHQGKPILEHEPCYELQKADAIKRGIIRQVEFFDGPFSSIKDLPESAIAAKVREWLDKHDGQDPRVKHQAMVLTQTKRDLNAAEVFKQCYEKRQQETIPSTSWDEIETYHGESSKSVLEKFDRGEIRVLVVCGKLLEGYDNKRVSVAAIARNVSKKSKVLFAQFVGRAVRKVRSDDPVTAMIISHPDYRQRVNFEAFEKVPEEDEEEDED